MIGFVVKAVVGLLAVGGVGTAVVVAVSPAQAAGDQAVVTHLVDGDTFDVSVGGRSERIRMLNIDTPETKDPNEPVQRFRPLTAVNDPSAPQPLRQALRVIDRHVTDYINEARMIA